MCGSFSYWANLPLSMLALICRPYSSRFKCICITWNSRQTKTIKTQLFVQVNMMLFKLVAQNNGTKTPENVRFSNKKTAVWFIRHGNVISTKCRKWNQNAQNYGANVCSSAPVWTWPRCVMTVLSRGIVLHKFSDVRQISDSQQQAGHKLKPACKDVMRQEWTSPTRSASVNLSALPHHTHLWLAAKTTFPNKPSANNYSAARQIKTSH